MRNKLLKKLEKKYKSKYFVEYKHDDVLQMSLNQNQLPFIFFITELPDVVYIYTSVEYSESLLQTIADESNKVVPAILCGEFYIGNLGNVHWDDEAYKYFNLEQKVDLSSLSPITQSKH